MSQKDLKQNSYNRSQLITHYRSAAKKVFGKEPYVHPKHISKFLVFEDDLRERGIGTYDYATTVVAMLEPWARKRNINYIPVNLFLGQYALDRYMSIANSDTVTISIGDDKDEILYNELMVARLYIQKNLQDVRRLGDIVSDLRPILSKAWLDIYESGKARPVTEALDVLCAEYGVSGNSYNDIVDAINDR
jgi:hypothetical protein